MHDNLQLFNNNTRIGKAVLWQNAFAAAALILMQHSLLVGLTALHFITLMQFTLFRKRGGGLSARVV